METPITGHGRFAAATSHATSPDGAVPTLAPPHAYNHASPFTPWTSALARPLSDIRELSEPSFVNPATRSPIRTIPRPPPASLPPPADRSAPSRPPPQPSFVLDGARLPDQGSSSYGSTPERASSWSIPASSVPRRSSSRGRPGPAAGSRRAHSRRPSLHGSQSHNPTPPPQTTRTASPDLHAASLTNQEPSESPVKLAIQRHGAPTSATERRAPCRTLIRRPPPLEILEAPTIRHPRINLALHVAAPLFVGGGSIEGHVVMRVDEGSRYRRRGRPSSTLAISALSIDLLGCEEVDPGRAAAFLALGVDLIDTEHPPPQDMLQPASKSTATTGAAQSWPLAASTTVLPFRLRLPLNTGPPPFTSKHARVHFLLSATATIRDDSSRTPARPRPHRIRTTRPDLAVLPTYDPERALAPPARPLTAADEARRRAPAGPLERITLTAGLGRPVWLAGASLFVDVHIANAAAQPVRRVHLSLERNVLCFDHAAAMAGLEEVPGLFTPPAHGGDGHSLPNTTSRIFTRNERTVIARVTLGSSIGERQRRRLGAGLLAWKPGASASASSSTSAAAATDADVLVAPHTAATRTCEVAVPRGHATVAGGKYVEVRYVLTVRVGGPGGGGPGGGPPRRHLGPVTVRLPVVLVHVNSLDVVPNAVPLVAAAMEERRLREAEEEEQWSRQRGRGAERAATASASRNGQRTREASQRATEDSTDPNGAPLLRRKPSQYTPGRAFAAPREQSRERQRAHEGELVEIRRLLEGGMGRTRAGRDQSRKLAAGIGPSTTKENPTVATRADGVVPRSHKPGRWSPLDPRGPIEHEERDARREERNFVVEGEDAGGESSRAGTPNSPFATTSHQQSRPQRHPTRQLSLSSQVPRGPRRPSRSRTATDATYATSTHAHSSSSPSSPSIAPKATKVSGLLRPAGFFRSDPSLRSQRSFLGMRSTSRAVAGSHAGMKTESAAAAAATTATATATAAWDRRPSAEDEGYALRSRRSSLSRGDRGARSRAEPSTVRRRSTSTATTHASQRDPKHRPQDPIRNPRPTPALALSPQILGLTIADRTKPPPGPSSSSRRVSFDCDPVILPSPLASSSSSPFPPSATIAASAAAVNNTSTAALLSLHEQQRDRRRFEVRAPSSSRSRKTRTQLATIGRQEMTSKEGGFGGGIGVGFRGRFGSVVLRRRTREREKQKQEMDKKAEDERRWQREQVQLQQHLHRQQREEEGRREQQQQQQQQQHAPRYSVEAVRPGWI